MKHTILERWLNSKVNDKDISNIKTIYDYSLRPYRSQHCFEAYYITTEGHDSDLTANDPYYTNMLQYFDIKDIQDDPELYKIARYVDHIFLYPNTNRYHANYLFRQLIDYTITNDLKCKSKYIITAGMKKAFYAFCMKHSNHQSFGPNHQSFGPNHQSFGPTKAI